MTSLALFDFDGTITDRDTYIAFIKHITPRHRMAIGYALLSPWIFGYKAGLVSTHVIRDRITFQTFAGWHLDDLHQRGREYAMQFFTSWVRPFAAERLQWHTEQNHRVVVVSASLDVYLQPWCEQHGYDLICSRLEVRNGHATGNYLGTACYGDLKANQVKDRYQLDTYDTIYAYGDTAEDEAMLAIADRSFYRGVERHTEKTPSK